METQRKDVDISSPRAKVWRSLLTSTLAGGVGVLSSLLSFANILQLSWAIVVALSAVFITASFTFALVKLERGSSLVVKLEESITAAYINALDESLLNPVSGGRR